MGMRRDMRVAAAASILLLAAGTGAAQAQNPFGASFAGGMRQIEAFTQAVNKVEVEITEATVSDTEILTIKWVLNNEDASIADDQSGYCVKVNVSDAGWNEECFSGAPASTQTYPRRETRYYMSMTNDDWPQRNRHKVRVQVKMEYGTGAYTSWSEEYARWQRF